ncbi:MAG: hypothetical protein K6G47_09390 [Clostridia bacterium]|nr:hypothetical protein [Clostridia bacterium]
MKKIVFCLFISVFFFVSLCSCSNMTYKYDNKPQIYDEYYEDIERTIVDKYGDYIYLTSSLSEKEFVFTLILKGKYVQDKKTFWATPDYKIMEDARVMINVYLDTNPNCQLNSVIDSRTLSLDMVVWGGDHYEKLFSVKENNDTKRLVTDYTVDKYMPVLYQMNSYECQSYINAMYDYIAQTGSDIEKIEVLGVGQIDNDEQKEWEDEIYSKFPLMTKPN